tara:strand:- start:401 stop:832 length:432 start_codon:yes stop_codon:yes gene_type:complete
MVSSQEPSAGRSILNKIERLTRWAREVLDARAEKDVEKGCRQFSCCVSHNGEKINLDILSYDLTGENDIDASKPVVIYIETHSLRFVLKGENSKIIDEFTNSPSVKKIDQMNGEDLRDWAVIIDMSKISDLILKKPIPFQKSF